ncbi:MAG: hypothetical protein ACKPEN_13550 [Planktothrix sp.]|uniref:hypothetical protein n=1 Tax=Planktothrix sp. TaxID=3088171 RepID=UPI0038D4F0E1
MQFTPGSGATITATTLENQFYTLCSMIQGIERDAAKNDKGVNLLSYTIDTDTDIASGSASVYCTITRNSTTGILEFSYPNPYTGITYSEGSGGDSKANGSILEAFVERAYLIIAAEREKKRNDPNFANKLSNPSWQINDVPLNSPVNHNALFKFSFSLQTQTTFTGSGENRNAVEYL